MVKPAQQGIPEASAEKLQQCLALWTRQVQAWASAGQLASAAVHALGLGHEPEGLTSLVQALAGGDFSGLPALAVLADDDLPGARSHFSDSSQTVYLNATWLAASAPQAVCDELTVRWGEHLDVVFNTSDTPGDEGRHFLALLSAGPATPPS